MRILTFSLFLAALSPFCLAQVPEPVLTPASAIQHVGELRTVCGSIALISTSPGSHGAPTFIDLDQAWPHAAFSLVIWGDYKDSVGDLPHSGRICASGRITLYHGRPEIRLTDWHSWYVPN